MRFIVTKDYQELSQVMAQLKKKGEHCDHHWRNTG